MQSCIRDAGIMGDKSNSCERKRMVSDNEPMDLTSSKHYTYINSPMNLKIDTDTHQRNSTLPKILCGRTSSSWQSDNFVSCKSGSLNQFSSNSIQKQSCSSPPCKLEIGENVSGPLKKPKQLVRPEEQDVKYRMKRDKNNESAKRSREKKRIRDQLRDDELRRMKEQNEYYQKENEHLKNEIVFMSNNINFRGNEGMQWSTLRPNSIVGSLCVSK